MVGEDFTSSLSVLLETCCLCSVHVQKHQDPPQLRSTRDRRGDPGLGAAVPPKDRGVEAAKAKARSEARFAA
jgi:hypothetical protein